MGIDLTHPVRLGILKEGTYLTQHFTGTYTALLCNANLIASFGEGVSGLIRQTVGRGTVSGYVLDPLTQILNIDRRAVVGQEGEIKAGVRRLYEIYGLDEKLVGRVPLSPDYIASKLARRLAQRCVEFQQAAVRSTARRDEEYIQFAEQSRQALSAFHPAMLIAPYLFVGPDDAEAVIEANGVLFKAAEAGAEAPLAAYLMVHQNALMDQQIHNKIVSTYQKLKPAVLFLWVTRFSEHTPASGVFPSVIFLVKALSRAQIPIIRVYGSFFSYLLKDQRIIGVIHGPGYGEERSEIPVGGGLPRPKFYLPRLHRRIDFTDAQRYLQVAIKSADSYYEQVCDCVACQRVIGKEVRNFGRYGETTSTTIRRYNPRTKRTEEQVMEYATPESIRLSTEHYMYAKYLEIKRVRHVKLSESIAELRATIKHFADTPIRDFSGHLELWMQQLS